MKKFYLVIVLLVSFLLIDNVQAKESIVTCTYNGVDSIRNISLRVILERYSKSDDDYSVKISVSNNTHYQNASAKGWNGTGNNFQDNLKCPRYVAAYIDPGYFGMAKYPVYFGNDENETFESVDTSGKSYPVMTAEETSYREEEANVCGSKDLVSGDYLDKLYPDGDVPKYFGLEAWYNMIELEDTNKCQEFDYVNANLSDRINWSRDCEANLSNMSNYYKGTLEVIEKMKSLGCVSTSDVLHIETIDDNIEKIKNYGELSEKKLEEVTNAGPAISTEPPEPPMATICGLFGPKTWSYIELAYNLIRYAVPILIIVLGMLDFVKVIFSGEDKDMKASGKSFMKRIIAGVILLLLPALLKFAFSIVGFSENCLQELL